MYRRVFVIIDKETKVNFKRDSGAGMKPYAFKEFKSAYAVYRIIREKYPYGNIQILPLLVSRRRYDELFRHYATAERDY